MNAVLSHISAALFVVVAVLFLATWIWWLFPLSLLFQVGIFAPNLVDNYRYAKRRKEKNGSTD